MMHQLPIYIGKVSIVLALFYCTYHLFLKNETFFTFNRGFLLTGILMALSLPFFEITRYIIVEPIAYKTLTSTSLLENLPGIAENSSIDWMGILTLTYLIGVLIFTIHFVIQLLSLYKLAHTNTVHRLGGYSYVECSSDIAPFSFFKYIFYNPDLYSKSELSLIVRHELVHSLQWHSFDVLLSHFVTIVTWVNPFSWSYRSAVKQNLEFLADEAAARKMRSVKNYQYTLLKVSGNKCLTPIVNTFYNSLIKKRIVMLSKSKSSKKSLLKTALIVPALAIFLFGFNTKEIEVPIMSESTFSLMDDTLAEIIKIRIDKDTSDEKLKEIKIDLAKKGVDFSYTVVHNASNEIISISIDFTSNKGKNSKMQSSSSYNNDDGPIDPIHIVYDTATNSISIGNSGSAHMVLHEDNDANFLMHSDDSDEEHKTVEIKKINGDEVIRVNGKKVSRKDYEAMRDKDVHIEKRIKIIKSKSDDHNNVFILNDSEHDNEDIIEIKDEKGFFFIDTDGEENTLYLIDGKKSTIKDVKGLDPSDIETMNYYKGDKAKEKYGKKGKDGVVEIVTRKQ